MSDKVVYGIDLGTTYSCLAKIDPITDQPVVILDNVANSASLPSAVAFPEDQEGVIVGAAAKEIAIEHPELVFQFFKRYMGRSDPNKPNYDPETPSYFARGKDYSPVELSAFVLERIKQYAADQGETVEDVIITVPAYFSLDQRAATKDAGRIAGLNVIATINEPTAAALAFAQGHLPENRLMLVYDLGGGTFDVTMIRLTPLDGNNYRAEVIVTDGNFKLGGADWDERMNELLKGKFAEESGLSGVDAIEPEDLNEIRGACERIKQQLSTRETVTARISGVKLTVTREEFDNATADLLQQTMDLMEAMLAAAQANFGISESEITDVLMVGGSTRMIQVQNMLKSRFGDERVKFNEPEKAVALGAAVAYRLTGNGGDLASLDATVDKLGLDPHTLIHVDDEGNAHYEDETGTQKALTDEEKKALGIDDSISGTTVTVTELRDKAAEAPKSQVVDVAPSTFGLIIRRNGEHAVDNVIPKGSVTGQTVTREYATPEGSYSMLILPVVQSDSQNEYDPCERNGNEYSFPGSVDRHMEVARMEIPVPSGMPEGTEVDVDISFDNLANLHIRMRIPDYGIEQELDLNFGTSDDEIARKQAEHKNTPVIDAY